MKNKTNEKIIKKSDDEARAQLSISLLMKQLFLNDNIKNQKVDAIIIYCDLKIKNYYSLFHSLSFTSL